MIKLTIPGTLPGLNEYTRANRSDPRAGNKMKQKEQEMIEWNIISQLKGKLKPPIKISYLWIEQAKRRDLDNIAFAQKFVQDALVKLGSIPDDGWGYIQGFTHDFAVDRKNPRVEITIYEKGEW
jgi:Holliday junction resolvase RusA-like endonuclease